MCRYLNQ